MVYLSKKKTCQKTISSDELQKGRLGHMQDLSFTVLKKPSDNIIFRVNVTLPLHKDLPPCI